MHMRSPSVIYEHRLTRPVSAKHNWPRTPLPCQDPIADQ
nr:MAG TPA: hypothetical protein [Caudoviricetes sp.]